MKLEVDPGEIFDKYSIIEIKRELIGDNPKFDKQIALLIEALETEIEEYNYLEILESQEYEELYHWNHIIFKVIEEIRKYDPEEEHYFSSYTAKQVDEWNSLRFQAKKKLQEKFFPEQELNEIKN